MQLYALLVGSLLIPIDWSAIVANEGEVDLKGTMANAFDKMDVNSIPQLMHAGFRVLYWKATNK